MKTKNAMQLKALINNKAKAAGVSPQLMLQNYMLERLIDRISRSIWRDSIIVKGGMLIGSLIGVERRTTKDLDTTVTGFELTHEKATEVFKQICAIEIDDSLEFELVRTADIREIDEYPGIRVFLKAKYAPLDVSITVDVTTGDKITPSAIVYDYPFVFSEGSSTVLAYPLETVLAEKLETILARSIANTRIRDFYDVYELWHLRADKVDQETLGNALFATCKKRNSVSVMKSYNSLLEEMRKDAGLLSQWENYKLRHSYAKDIDFTSTVNAVATVTEIATKGFNKAQTITN
jgi:hypothetical protein